MLGARKGFNLAEIGYSLIEPPEEYINSDDFTIVDDVLNQFGLETNSIGLENDKNVCESIIELIDEGKPVMVLFDEYYIFYSNFYKVKHTNHLTVVNGYDKKRKIYILLTIAI